MKSAAARLALVLTALVNVLACGPSDASSVRTAGAEAAVGAEAAAAADAGRVHQPEVAPVGVVDSTLPIEEHLRRFRMNLGEQPTTLDGVASRDELIERFIHALERGDGAALQRLALTRAEFAYLYYPASMYTRRPYELSPEILWMQMEHNSAQGLTRALKRLGGKPLEYRGYACPGEAVEEGKNRYWRDCTLRLGPASAPPARLFGSVMERDGRFKFVGYANPL